MNISRRDAMRTIAASAAVVGLGRGTTLRAQQGAGAAGAAVAAGINMRAIPKSGEAIPCIGMGTSRTFDVPPGGDINAQVEVMRAFINAGGTVIDSSPMYGDSESVIGETLKQVEHPRMFYATKVWTDEGPDEGVSQMKDSMRRMGTDVIDLMQVHNLVAYEDHMPTLRQWKDEGIFRYIGITEMRDMDRVIEIMQNDNVDFIQIPYSMNDRRVEERVLPAAQDTGTAVLVMRPFGRNLFEHVRGRELPVWASEFGCASWAQFFLKWLLGHPAITCPIPATSKARHMVDNMAAAFGDYPDAAMRQKMLTELGL
jgi:diketogulonate reductase-like aldo/keto reductase